MKKSRSTRILSLFAAVIMVVSLFSTMAFASDAGIQPHLASCPECGGETYYAEIGRAYDKNAKVGHHNMDPNNPHYYAYEFRAVRCNNCYVFYDQVILREGYYCKYCTDKGPNGYVFK